MKASELRIGNWVRIGENFRITEIKTNEVYGDFWTHYIDVGSIDPIPLTPEILEKVGFGKKESMCGHYSLILDDGEIVFESDEFSVYSGLGDPESYGFTTKIKYVHQLQNLIFALTGEELTINL